MEKKKYVDFDKVITTYKTFGHLNLHNMLEAFNEIPAADVVPIKHGKWIDEIDSWDRQHIGKCSECGQKYCDFMYFHFCPNCGADMREVINE